MNLFLISDLRFQILDSSFVLQSIQSVINLKARHSRESESGNPGKHWIPGQARNDKKEKTYVIVYILFLGLLIILGSASGQTVNPGGWPVPDLKGLVPYSITVRRADGVEKLVEKFYTPDGGHVAKISGNGKVFAYAVDSDREPPIDFLILDADGSRKFTQKFESEDFYPVPEWVSP